jgi:transcriptional regulator with XRE-family HTH domain
MAEEKLYIGSRLRTARRKQKIKINRAVKDLCIPKKYLSAFEKNDLSQFPDNAYAVGFLKNYADYLGLDQGSLVKELKGHLRFEPLDISTCRPLDQQNGHSLLAKAAVLLLIGLVISGAYFGWTYFKGNDYKLSQVKEIPAHLAAFLIDEDPDGTSVQPLVLLANGSDRYFQSLGGTGGKIRILAFADTQLAISDASGKVLHQGLMYSGESIDLPRGIDLRVFAADYSALGFYIGEKRAKPSLINLDGILLVALDALKPGIDTPTPAS